MRPSSMSANALFEDHRSRFAWEWVAGRRASDRRFDDIIVQQAKSGADLVGYLNYLHAGRLQVLGKHEIDWLTQASDEQSERRITRIAALNAPALVLTEGAAAPPALARLCDSANIPLFATQAAASSSLTNSPPTSRACLPTAPRCMASSWTFSALACSYAANRAWAKASLGWNCLRAGTASWPTTWWTCCASATTS